MIINGFLFVIGALGALVAIFLALGLITAIGVIIGDATLPRPIPQRHWQPEEDYEPRLGDIE